MSDLQSSEEYQRAFVAQCIATGRIPSHSPAHAGEEWHPEKVAVALGISHTTVKRRIADFIRQIKEQSVAQCAALKERAIVNLIRDGQEARRMYDELTAPTPCVFCEAKGCLFCNNGYVDPKENKHKLTMAERFLRTSIQAWALIANLTVDAGEREPEDEFIPVSTLEQAEEIFRRTRIKTLALKRPGR